MNLTDYITTLDLDRRMDVSLLIEAIVAEIEHGMWRPHGFLAATDDGSPCSPTSAQADSFSVVGLGFKMAQSLKFVSVASSDRYAPDVVLSTFTYLLAGSVEPHCSESTSRNEAMVIISKWESRVDQSRLLMELRTLNVRLHRFEE